MSFGFDLGATTPFSWRRDVDLRSAEPVSRDATAPPRLAPIVGSTAGSPEIQIALIDGIIERSHPSLAGAIISEDERPAGASAAGSAAAHATFIASILVGCGPGVLGVCRGARLASVPIADLAFEQGRLPARSAAARIARAVERAVAGGADVILLSLEFAPEMSQPFDVVARALAAAASRGIRTVIAAGNGSTLGSNLVLGAPGVVPVAMAAADGSPHIDAALGPFIGTRGLLAPGVDIPGATLPAGTGVRSGSSFSAAIVAGSYALLRSGFPEVRRELVWESLLDPGALRRRRASIVPPLLDTHASLMRLKRLNER